MREFAVGDTVIRCTPGLRGHIDRTASEVVEVNDRTIRICTYVDIARYGDYDAETGVNVWGRDYGWLEKP